MLPMLRVPAEVVGLPSTTADALVRAGKEFGNKPSK